MAALIQPGGSPIPLDESQQTVVDEETAQTAPVVGQSVVTFVCLRHDEGDHLAVDLAQTAGACHGGPIQRLDRSHSPWVQGVDLHYVVDGVIRRVGYLRPEQSKLLGPGRWSNCLDPGHSLPFTASCSR